MLGKRTALLVFCMSLPLTACGQLDNSYLIFGQKTNVGLEVSGGVQDQGGSLNLGYKDQNIAIIPVARHFGANDTELMLLGSANNASETADSNDAYSVLGQFEISSEADGTPSVGLGKFFATGIAAQNLSEGFQAKLANQAEE